MKKSESIKAIGAALKVFHVKVEDIKKTADNPFFKSKYAPLDEILPSIQLPLDEAGLVFTQFPDEDSLTTLLMHPESGEWMEASYNIHPAQATPQAIGSAITYARRYALCSILGLNIVADDDGNASSIPGVIPASQLPAKKQLPWLNVGTPEFEKACVYMASVEDKAQGVKDIRKKYAIGKDAERGLLEC